MHNKSTLDQIQQPEFKKETTKLLTLGPFTIGLIQCIR